MFAANTHICICQYTNTCHTFMINIFAERWPKPAAKTAAVMIGADYAAPEPSTTPSPTPNSGNPFTIATVPMFSLNSFPINRTMYSGLSARLGSSTIPLRLSVLTRYWSVIHSSAERFPAGKRTPPSGSRPASARASPPGQADTPAASRSHMELRQLAGIRRFRVWRAEGHRGNGTGDRSGIGCVPGPSALEC